MTTEQFASVQQLRQRQFRAAADLISAVALLSVVAPHAQWAISALVLGRAPHTYGETPRSISGAGLLTPLSGLAYYAGLTTLIAAFVALPVCAVAGRMSGGAIAVRVVAFWATWMVLIADPFRVMEWFTFSG